MRKRKFAHKQVRYRSNDHNRCLRIARAHRHAYAVVYTNYIKYKNYIFDSWVWVEDNSDFYDLSNATITKLSELKLKKNDKLEMENFMDGNINSKSLE